MRLPRFIQRGAERLFDFIRPADQDNWKPTRAQLRAHLSRSRRAPGPASWYTKKHTLGVLRSRRDWWYGLTPEQRAGLVRKD